MFAAHSRGVTLAGFVRAYAPDEIGILQDSEDDFEVFGDAYGNGVGNPAVTDSEETDEEYVPMSLSPFGRGYEIGPDTMDADSVRFDSSTSLRKSCDVVFLRVRARVGRRAGRSLTVPPPQCSGHGLQSS